MLKNEEEIVIVFWFFKTESFVAEADLELPK